MKKLTDEIIQGAIDRNPEYEVMPGVSINPATCKACLLGICAVDAGFLEGDGLTDHQPTIERMGKHLSLDAIYSWGVVLGFEYIAPSTSVRAFCANSPAYREGLAVGQKWREKLGYPMTRGNAAEAVS